MTKNFAKIRLSDLAYVKSTAKEAGTINEPGNKQRRKKTTKKAKKNITKSFFMFDFNEKLCFCYYATSFFSSFVGFHKKDVLKESEFFSSKEGKNR